MKFIGPLGFNVFSDHPNVCLYLLGAPLDHLVILTDPVLGAESLLPLRDGIKVRYQLNKWLALFFGSRKKLKVPVPHSPPFNSEILELGLCQQFLTLVRMFLKACAAFLAIILV